MIYSKLDNYTVMCYNKSLREILEKLHCYEDTIDLLFEDYFELQRGVLDSRYRIAFNGVVIMLYFDDADAFFDQHEGSIESMVDAPQDRLRIEIQGKGLEWLRSRSEFTGLYPDAAFHDPAFWGEPDTYKVTRCDFAFDFINVNDTFMEEFIAVIRDLEENGHYLHEKGARLRVGTGSGLSYKYHWGSSIKCFYFGSSSSQVQCRMYDKELEQRVKAKNAGFMPSDALPEMVMEYEKKNGHDVISSWFRIEIQARDQQAQILLFQPQAICDYVNKSGKQICSWSGDAFDYEYVLRYFSERFMIRDDKYEIIKPLTDLFDWSKLPKLVSLNCEKQEIDVVGRAETYIFGIMFNMIIAYIAVVGLPGFLKQLKDRLLEIQTVRTAKFINKNRAMRGKINEFALSKHISRDMLFIKEKNGIISIKDL